MYGLARPFLFHLDAEQAHGLGLKSLEIAYRTGMNPLLSRKPAPLKTKAFGIEFPNPVGCAAGLDKNGEHIDALMALGFGFVEIGTVTPRPQEGNPKPRMFRLPEHNAVINRLGFNNAGVDVLVRNVEKAKRNGILGINIGKNKDTPNENAADDYVYCMERVYTLADYITVNISSPNTTGLRDLQQEDTLRRFIGELREVQEDLAALHGHRVPMLIKLAPDLTEAELDRTAHVLNLAKVDGVIMGNTTLDRLPVEGHKFAGEAGGLSGQPLYGRSTAALRRLRNKLDDNIPLVGVGGIVSGADAAGKVAAGATLVQFYTGMIYRGPELIGECVKAIRRRREGVA
ncbi:MAG TPA: quinone-dependent dihydroorotate dehydrogenase [Luteimonas sp.]|nr:quinone-dependent dihydroorotate dehydrogenase [Luteimonas sp.]